MVLVLKEKRLHSWSHNPIGTPQLLLFYNAHPQHLEPTEMLTQHIPQSWNLTQSCVSPQT